MERSQIIRWQPAGRRGPAEDARLTRVIQLGIMCWHTCNIECRHCGILSGPRNRSRMPLHRALEIIDAAAALAPMISTVVFTGGEPFIYKDELRQMLARCKKHRMPTRVVTNGFWAANPRGGYEILLDMKEAGLTSLNFSADKWHLEFLAAETLRNAIDCAFLLGFPVVVNMAVTDTQDPVGDFCRLYDIPRADVVLYDKHAFVRAQKDEAAARRIAGKIHLSWGRLVALGRAREKLFGDLDMRPADAFPDAGCPEIVERPVIYPDGDLQACCCAGGKIAEFRVGNVFQEPLGSLLARMAARSHFRFLNAFGPVSLFHAATRAKGADRFSSICDVCVAATSGLEAEAADRLAEQRALQQVLWADRQPG